MLSSQRLAGWKHAQRTHDAHSSAGLHPRALPALTAAPQLIGKSSRAEIAAVRQSPTSAGIC
jgi:hypothetical protein